MRTRVKICGITQRQDAEFAAEIGADAIGLVFYSASPRAVTVAQAKQLIVGLSPFVSVVALFVDAEVSEVESCLASLPIDMLQFHGEESPDYCAQFKVPYMKAVRMREDTDLVIIAQHYHTASALLLDSYQAGVPGGTGQVFDWSMIEKIDMPIVLAGGLTVDNVSSAIQQVQPYAVDVSGGVEQDKGIKDKMKINAFMREVNNG
jgi:phosphoribosylanthranilate isomerase